MLTCQVPLPKFLHTWLGFTHVHVGFISALYHMDRGALKLLWATAQIMVSVSYNLDMTFPEPYGAITNALSFVQVQAT